MPTIVPPSRNQLGEVIVELESLGGKAKEDFRISRTRTGEAVLEVSDELYGKWDSGKSKRVGLKADESDGDADTGSDADSGADAKKSAAGNDDTADSKNSSARKRR